MCTLQWIHTLGDRKYVFTENKGFIKSRNQTAKGLVFKLNGMNADFNKRMIQEMMRGDDSTFDSSFEDTKVKEVYTCIHTYTCFF